MSALDCSLILEELMFGESILAEGFERGGEAAFELCIREKLSDQIGAALESEFFGHDAQCRSRRR